MLGAIGSSEMADVVIFEVSEESILTLDEFKRKNSVRYADTDVMLKKPISQFLGEALDEISFKIVLKDYYGVDPRTEMNKLIYIQRDGEAVTFVLDGKGFGRYRWTIRSIDMEFAEIDGQGIYHSVTLNVTMKEYARGY